MFTVAPTETTNRVTRGSILLFSSRHRKVTGKVAALKALKNISYSLHKLIYKKKKKKEVIIRYLDAVPKAVIQACIIPLKNTAGFCRVINQNIAGIVIIA